MITGRGSKAVFNEEKEKRTWVLGERLRRSSKLLRTKGRVPNENAMINESIGREKEEDYIFPSKE